MRPDERIRYVFYTYVRRILVIVGHDIFTEETFKPNWLTYTMYGLHVIVFTGAVKTIYFYDLAEKLNMVAFIGLALQVNHV